MLMLRMNESVLFSRITKDFHVKIVQLMLTYFIFGFLALRNVDRLENFTLQRYSHKLLIYEAW